MMARSLAALWALAPAACFTGGFLAGQPCASDADCGPSLRCELGVCGGPSGEASSSSSSTSDAPTGTSTSATSTSGVTSGGTSSGSSTSPSTGSSSSGDATTGATCGLGRCKDLDLLFVVDNSPSMGTKGQVLLAAVLAFGNVLTPTLREACSIHLGLVTTDDYLYNPPGCQTLGALVQADTAGNPCVFAEGLPYATEADLENPANLACLFGVGTDGSGDERPMDAVFSIFKASLNQGCNAGFHRKDAILAVVIATDEDDDDNDQQGHDGSTDFDEAFWPSVLTNFKGGVEDLYVLGLLGDPDQQTTSCPWMPAAGADGLGAEAAPNLRGFIESFPPEHQEVGSLCRAPDPVVYEPLMQKILADLQAICATS